MQNILKFYLLNEQPTTCPICGAKTNWIADFSHTQNKMILHKCLDLNCKYLFAEIEV